MIKVSIKGVDKVVEYLRTVPLGIKTVAGRSVAEYLVGNESHGLKHAPGYKHINRYAGFPELSYENAKGETIHGYKSAQQHRYVMWAISKGIINPGQNNRTGNLQNSWVVGGEPPRYVIKNNVKYAGYVLGEEDQTRMHNLIGWRRVSQNIADNIAGAIRAANLAIAKWLKEHK
jgi:hypothetical protein